MSRLERPFFEGSTLAVARRLLGCVLVRVLGGKRLAGVIVEVEAYRGEDDPASHAYGGLTQRNKVMFGEPGHAYVYFTMGIHWCLNVTTESAGTAGAVLVRAIEPVEGVDVMAGNRRGREMREIASGPAKLTQAMQIDGNLNGEDLVVSPRLFLEKGRPVRHIVTSSRIGVSRGTEYPWRFYDEGSQFVSKGKPTTTKPRTHN